MSVFGAMRTSVAGMSAQSQRIGSVAENIANSSTTGYKRSSTEFETVLGDSRVSSFTTGGVTTKLRHAVSDQGSLVRTSSGTDLAVSGDGFFVVSRGNGAQRLTRAGAFVPNGAGDLVNSGGYSLMGYDLRAGAAAGALTKVNINQSALTATPSTAASLTANLPSDAAIVPAGQLPSTNSAGAAYSAKTSLTTFDNLGHRLVVDMYFSKTSAGNWEATAYDASQASASGGFPYASGPLATQALTFSSANGALTSPANGVMNVAIPNGQTLALNLSKTTQLAAGFSVLQLNVNGNAPSAVDHIEIATDGTLSALYQDGTRIPLFKIPLADVISPDNLTPGDANTYSESASSGSVLIGPAGEAGRGSILSSSLEASNVDLGSELTTMIEAQRSYTANSKVFQAGSELLDVLMNLKV